MIKRRWDNEKKVAVIGSRGFIGGHISHLLEKNGFEVVNVQRHIDQSDKRAIFCDFNSTESIKSAFKDCHYLVYANIPYANYTITWKSDWAKSKKEFERVLDVASEHPFEKCVFISVAVTVGPSAESELADEGCEFENPKAFTAFPMKHDSEVEIQKRVVEKNLPGVILNCSLAFGPYDRKPSSGRFLIMMSKLPFYFLPNYEVNIIDVRDIARSVMATLTSDITGERILVANKGLKFYELHDYVRAISNKSKPYFTMPEILVIAFAYCTEIVGKLLKKSSPFLPLLGVHIIQYGNRPFNLTKMKTGLGIKATDPFCAIKEALDWFKSNGKF